MVLSLLQLSALGLSACLVAALWTRRKRQRLPPGPPGKFLIGNLYDFPRPPEEWKAFADFGKLYGPVTYLCVLTQDVVVLNTMRAATDLLDKRSAIYSDRPRLPMLNEVMGFDWLPTTMSYGPQWRQHRRALNQELNDAASRRMWGIHEELNVRFLKRLADTPDAWWELTRWLAGANVMRLAFGMQTALKDDPWVALGFNAVNIASRGLAVGTFAVDWLPVLKYVPSWLPGAQFKRDGRVWREIQRRARDLPFQKVVENMASGQAVPCMTTQLLERDFGGAPLSEDVVKNAVGVVYIAGADTTLSAINAFFHAMVLYPDAQRTAQEELDRVLDGSRLPTLHDRAQAPYVEALVRETMRMYPVTPLGLAHRLIEDDEYEGMRLPKGATVIVNTWAILNDEHAYPEPARFRPERYLKDGILDESVLDPHAAFFGHGRRICPGRYVADAELWLLVATVLTCFDIRPAKDDHGEDILPEKAMSSTIISAIAEFPCKIELRDETKRYLILEAFEHVEPS